ncbi:ribonuclease Z [Candidatus Micrarchaeota archaeon]|nr:ribonuclease Z [Candidatus Micrarchaeota archaeon]
MKIYFLGTNGWHDTETGETPSVLIDSKKAYIVLDAGNSLRKLDRFVKEDKPIYIFLSHFHLDHIFGLHILMKFRFSQPVTLVGQPGTKEVMKIFLAKPFTAPPEMINSRYPFTIHEIQEGSNDVNGINVEARFLLHADPCFGYSFYIDGKKITYCTDTGRCDNLARLAKDSDLLMAECSWKQEKSDNWPHLTPEGAADAAKQANAAKLVLLHFDPVNYPRFSDRQEAKQRASKIFENTEIAMDDMLVEVD